jgi:hypothetical protein
MREPASIKDQWPLRVDIHLPVRIGIRSPKNDDFAFKRATNRGGQMVYDSSAKVYDLPAIWFALKS